MPNFKPTSPTQYAKSTSKTGKVSWYRDCRLADRYIRVAADVALLAIATGAGVEVDYLPASRPELWLAKFAERQALREMPCSGMVQ